MKTPIHLLLALIASAIVSSLTVTLPTGIKATPAQPVNLRGEPAGEPIAIINGQFTVPLGAWAPASFILP